MATKSRVAVSTSTAARRTATKPAASQQIESKEQYDVFENRIRSRVSQLTSPLFTTNVDPDRLWEAYLAGFPADRRQHYNCNCCRRFLQKYGGLATIDEQGGTAVALWYEINPPKFFFKSIDRVARLVGAATINGVFLSDEAVWGTPKTGEWSHLSGTFGGTVFTHAIQSCDQAMAQKKEDYGMLQRALADFTLDHATQALRVLKADAVDRSEKALGVAQFFHDLHTRIAENRRKQDELVWRAVAMAPVGFCHVRSSLIGTLLEDIVAGLPFNDIKQKWAEKVDPINYQRPKAAPKAGTIDRANKLVEEMGLTRSLERRFATLDDVLVKDWEPRTARPAKAAKTGGAFDHLRQPQPATGGLDISGGTLTWEKFARVVLPEVLSLEIWCPNNGNYYGATTAVRRKDPPILQWDGLEGLERNPVSLYVYRNGSSPSNWSLSHGWNKVTAVFRSPWSWQRPEVFNKHQGNNVHFAIEGCRDTRNAGLALFPETIRSELHEVRAVIEAHSNAGRLSGGEEASANGLAFSSNTKLRVTTAEGRAEYVIDRMD